ncbi:MAG: glycosyltransferase [Chromatiales bacterium]|nr:glycosyltransferase [Chromatiales bacterium]
METTNEELVVRVESVTGRQIKVAPVAHPRRITDAEHRFANPTLARDVLGWLPQHDLQAGLRHTVAWYKANPQAWSNTADDAPGHGMSTRATEGILPTPLLSQVAVLVPVYQNAGTLEELAKQIAGALADAYPAYQLVFVVDASPDDSWQIIRQLAQGDNRICGLLLGRNQGQHRALMTGLRQIQARWVVVMDADLQDSPALLPELIDECARTGVTIFARRAGQYQSVGRMITSRVFKYLLGRWIDLPPDVGSYFVVPESVAAKMRCARIKLVQLVVMARLFSPAWGSVRYVREVRAEGGRLILLEPRMQRAYKYRVRQRVPSMD